MLALRTAAHVERSVHPLEQDGSIREAAVLVLKARGYSSVAKLDCRVDQGVVELAGVVPTFHMKQVAQSAILRLEAVRGIRNKVRVG